ncbi:MAG: peptidoglycan DD-metalloendopeptidase family protein [Bacilli bacterium]|nr:peptidoglycan DD-metalloendopeptidase family protein [Bacilli bacterium]
MDDKGGAFSDVSFSYKKRDLASSGDSYASFKNRLASGTDNLKSNLSMAGMQVEDMSALKQAFETKQKLTAAEKRAYDELCKVMERYNELSKQSVIDIKDATDFLDTFSKTLMKNNKIFDDIGKTIEGYGSDVESLIPILQEVLQANRDLNDTINNSKSLFEDLHGNITKLKGEFKDLATITGLDNIYNSLSGGNGQLATYNSMRSQFSMTKGDFNAFKRDITSQIVAQGNVFKYGFQDALDYMNRLGELGITDQEIAREQLDAVLLSTKYLGMSAETQSKIFKQARNTNNMDLLNQTNRTMVQIMNAQLGVSKSQLDAIVNQSTELADLSIMFSGNTNSLQSFTKAGSALTSVYGEPTSKAAMQIASDLLNNGAGSRYVSVLGSSYGDIIQGLQSGDGRALNRIVQAIQGSSVSQAGKSNATAWASLTGAGILDQNTMAIAQANRINGKTFESALGDIEKASGNTESFLSEMQVDFKTMLENFTSWLTSWIPLGAIQHTYYLLATADLAFGVGRGIFEIRTLMKKQLLPGLKAFASGDQEAISKLLGTGPDKGVLGGIKGITTALVKVGGTLLIIKDLFAGISKAEDWGTSQTSAAIGSVLGGSSNNPVSNVTTGAIKGASVGAWLGHPVIGATIGAFLGMIGGKNIAQFLGDSGSAPITSLSYGRGDASSNTVSTTNFPWRMTSPFGYRGTLQTKAGATNPFHNGIDLAYSEGTPIGANNSGIVSASGTSNDGANYVIINSQDGYEQLYWHLKEQSPLQKGQFVSAGQFIGLMGQTGRATGPHLHFGLRRAGTTDYIDPKNSINPTLFSPGDTGINNLGVWLPSMTESGRSTTLISRLVDADTMSKEAQALSFDGVGSSSVVNAVDSGFAGLIKKLEELSVRQDEQETILRMLSQGKQNNLYKI